MAALQSNVLREFVRIARKDDILVIGIVGDTGGQLSFDKTIDMGTLKLENKSGQLLCAVSIKELVMDSRSNRRLATLRIPEKALEVSQVWLSTEDFPRGTLFELA